MRNLRSIFQLLFLVLVVKSFAQAPSLSKVIKPSPDVQAMQKYGEIPISQYTGVPSISIPLYTIQFRDIKLPISVSYHASGIKVAEEASRVGLGWALNAGGNISRNIIGEDDWFGTTYFTSANNNLPDLSNGKGPTNMVQSGCNLECFDRFGNNTIWNLDMTNYLNASPVYDFQPDQYFFNLPTGSSGKFLLKRNKDAVIQSQQSLQISPTQSDGTNWKIVDENGYIYEFNIFETYKGYTGNPHTSMSAWYLTKLTSPAGNAITFNYTTQSAYTTPVGVWSETRDDHAFPSIIYNGFGTFSPQTSGSQAGWVPGKNYTTVLLSSIDFVTGAIQFNYSARQDVKNDYKLDNVAVYSKNASGTVNTTPIKTIAFTYDYFNGGSDVPFGNGNPATGYDALRLKLTKVQESGTANGQTSMGAPYLFTYNESGANVLPAKTSFARDHWGYYNGKTNKTSLIPTYAVNSAYSNSEKEYYLGIQGNERDANPYFMQAFSLQSMIYPTGGSTEFQYESNTFDEQLSQVNDHSAGGSTYTIVKEEGVVRYDYNGGKHWTSSVNTVDMSDEYLSPQNTTLPLTLNVTYRFSSSSGCSQIDHSTGKMTFNIYNQSNIDMLGTKDIQLFYSCAVDLPDNCLSCDGPTATYKTTISLPPGKYRVEVYVNDASYSATLQDIKFDFLWSTQVNSNNATGTTFSYGGGLRIKKIIDHSAVSSIPDKITKYLYHLQKDQNNDGTQEEYSYGIRMSKPNYSNFTKTVESNKVQLSSGAQYTVTPVYHLMRSADSDIPLNGSAGGCVVGYSNVTVLYGENGENGRTVYTYHNQPDIINLYSSANYSLQPPYSSTIADALNGSLLNQTDYKNTGSAFQKIKEVTNAYTTSSGDVSARIENIVYGVQSVPFITYSSTSNAGDESGFTRDGSSSGPCDRIEMSYQTLQSEWSYLSGTDAKLYDPSDANQYAETVTNYTYDNATLLPSVIKTNNSKGEQITTTTKYPLNYITGTATDAFTNGIKNLLNKHIINAPIETYKQRSNSDGTNTRTISSVLTSYNSSLPLPSLIYQTQSTSPMTTFVPASINTSGLVKDANYTSNAWITLDSYDVNGNLLQQHKVNDLNKSYIWDYNSNLPVAEVDNASQTDVAYTSFEWDGKGGWTFSGATTVESVAPPTGNNSYNLSGGNITKAGLASTTNYIVSYWTKNTASYTITGTTTGYPIKGRSFNGWTYYEHRVTGVTSVAISGSGYIDELRLYPSNAQMTTYTYTPLVGMSSQCDINNRMTYYQYDGLQRLKTIRDQNWSIVKRYNYAYQTPVSQTNNVSISCTNQSGYANYYVSFTSTTGESPTFTVPLAGGTLGSIPAGTYNITFTSSPPIAGSIFKVGCNPVLTATGTTATFSNVAVTTSTCNTTTISVP